MNLKEMADQYAQKYPKEIRDIVSQAWLDGRHSSRKKEALDLSFVGDRYRDIFEYWLRYKKERGQTYKQSGVEACYRKLVKMSNGDPQTALSIIEQSVSNNWAGLFELKSVNYADYRRTDKTEANQYALQQFLDNKERAKDSGTTGERPF